MKIPAFTYLLGLGMIILLSCNKNKDKPIDLPDPPPWVKITIDFPFAVEAPGNSLEDATSLEELVSSSKLTPIPADKLSQFLVPEEIEQVLGLTSTERRAVLPPKAYSYKEIGMISMPNYRIVIFLKEALEQDPKLYSVILRTFCSDNSLMGHKRLAHWDEEKGLAISGSLSPYLELKVGIKNQGTSSFQIDEFGKIIPITP